jgi:hypothetical protein
MAYSSIVKPSDYFNTKLYAGNGNDNTSITGVGFQPDLSWVKARDKVENNLFTDAVRGGNKQIYSNLADAETSDGNKLKSFNADGFTIGTSDVVNNSISNYVAWNWKANGAGSANTDGSISSTVSANTTSGFSIVKYTGNAVAGATIGHGLGVAPKMIIVKKLNGAPNWAVYHASTTDFRYYLELNTTAATQLDSAVFDNVPTSSTFLVGSDNKTNGSSGDYIAYCFAEKKGFNKFGSYVGTNSGANGPFIYTGFKPAFILIKNASAAADWNIRDNKRDTYNAATHFLVPNSNSSEVTLGEAIDILSNGFKIKANGLKVQDSGNTYIYMAFAENPLVGTNNIPATAR